MESVGAEQGQINRSNDASFDIENPHAPLINSMEKELESLSPLSPGCSIYRVRERLRDGNEKAYTPQVVSIGPFHHETIPFSSDEFVKIILVDAAFIIEVFLFSYFKELEEKNDRIFIKPWMKGDIWRDIILLENQIPFFILEDLFDPDKLMVQSPHGDRLSLVELSCNVFKQEMHLKETEDKLKKTCFSKVVHLVDLLRHLYLPSKEQNKRQLQISTTPTVTELHRAGIKFKVASSKNIFDIQFNEGILEIPKFVIRVKTELQIRNIIAFEQCHCTETYMNDYVVIMDRLANTAKDVDLLSKYGIVDKRGDNSEAATLINRLSRGAMYSHENFYFASLSDDLNSYCRASWHEWKANLKQNYFNTPWAVISFIAAVVLLLLTFTQTVSSVISIS
ncbi:hypothetical protein CJ030_MR8G020620 [Morella rubra]|uniref:Uncharacterized protein n=1 Tax=Morella rubra TaxID=262757 RepID=A0A6A1UY32_9ROSI|nr:hypothetical protein CJ030_MR8G020620 [Morella rubra]